MVKKILVTGINGYIGTVLAEKLQKGGYEVVGWDTNYFKEVTLGNYQNRYASKNLDIRQKQPELSGIDCIIHLAALSNDPMGALNEKLAFDINYKATIKLAKKAKLQGVKRFIFSSSCSAYGVADKDIVNEESAINPLTVYAKSKVLVEKALKKLKDDSFCVCLLRNATVYGFSPRFRNDLVVNNLVTSGLAFNEIRVLSDGTPWRPLIDVRDLCEVICRFVEVDAKAVNGNIFNVGFNTNNYQVKYILKLIKQYLPKCRIKFSGEHGKDTRSYKVNFSKLKELFPNIKQKWPLEKSIPDLIKRLRTNKFKKEDFEQGKFERLTKLKSLISEKKLTKDLNWRSNMNQKLTKNSNILITGGNGMVGSLVNFGIRFSHKDLDVCNIKTIEKAFETYKPSVLLHLAALDINTCQQYPDKAYAVNVVGTFNIAKACRKKGVKMVYVSTCILFDGTKKIPYNEDDMPNPIHIYGQTKRMAELITLDLIPNCLVIRPGWLFGNNKVNKGFVNICLNSLKNNEDLTVNALDRSGSPTYIPDLLTQIKQLIDQDANGIYHIVNSGIASYYEIGREIRRLGKFKAMVKEVSDTNIKPEFPKRGKMEALTSKKIKLRSWQSALAEYLTTI